MQQSKERLRIGLLLDSFLVPAWAFEMLKVIIQQDLGDICHLIINQNPTPSGTKSSFLYRAFSKLDRSFFKVSQNAFERKDIREIPDLKAETIKALPIQGKYSDRFGEQDLAKIEEQKPDILIRLGFRILKGEILQIPTLGVWSFHHGDNLVNKGGPPCFWEVMLGWEETGSVLQILTDRLDQGTVISRSWSRTDPLSVHRNANKVYWKSLYFIPRTLHRIQRVGVEEWKREIRERDNELSRKNSLIRKPPGNLAMIGLSVSWARRNLSRKLKESMRRESWSVWVFGKDLHQGIKVANPKGGYLADPFIFEKNGKSWLFVEHFDYKENKGFISGAEIENHRTGEFQKVLEEDFHLSYPFVFEEEDQLWMLVESASKKQLRLYLSEDFPNSWRCELIQFEGHELYDPTLCLKNGLYWLFVNQKAHSGASSFDELFLYYSEDFKAGNWISHPQNPIVSDVKSSRPAGALFQKDDKWYRPAQDSAKHYGHRIRIQEILHWDTETYKERTVEIKEANWAKGWQGTHTINLSSQWTVMDTFKR